MHRIKFDWRCLYRGVNLWYVEARKRRLVCEKATRNLLCDSGIMVITRASQARDGGPIPLCRLLKDSVDTKTEPFLCLLTYSHKRINHKSNRVKHLEFNKPQLLIKSKIFHLTRLFPRIVYLHEYHFYRVNNRVKSCRKRVANV